jgi:hypothetical protein
MNYRRLLDRNMSCNWTYIVDKIICNNDQQASIFLQQKLKVGTPEQKYEIVAAIISQAYALMVNRFGNFLVQRCFEHGTHEQVIAIAQAIRGNTLALSMDAFGCHVIQKAFDCVPEEYKATMVHELLRRIPETVIHRYACHVWQKLFELRWSDSPPQIMRYVNEALRGMWHEVALGETGSLVVQNIFENCLEEDKACHSPSLIIAFTLLIGNSVHVSTRCWPASMLSPTDSSATGAFSTSANMALPLIVVAPSITSSASAPSTAWISMPPKSLRSVSRLAAASSWTDTLTVSARLVLTARACLSLIVNIYLPVLVYLLLITGLVAGDQFGNYLIQYILTNSSSHHREIVGGHIRKHMVSLRGSKYGSRVAMLCCNPALATRPGPPTGILPRYGNPAPRPSFGAFR